MAEELIAPNLIIAGVTKAGTTSLFTYLSDHPDVCGSTVKEISHFVTVRFGEPARPIGNYSQYFMHCSNEKYRLESSPAYFLGGHELAEAIKTALPDVKVVLVLREPSSRCLSHFKFTKNMLKLPKDVSLEEYFVKCQEIPAEAFRERKNHVYYGLASGIYSNYIDGWIDAFGDNLHICFFDDLMSNPRKFTQSLCKWLALDPLFFDSYDFVIENKGRNFKNSALQKLALKLNKNFERFLRRHIALKRALRRIYFFINGSRSGGENIRGTSDTVNRIRAYYLPYNRILREKLTAANVENLPEWLADEELLTTSDELSADLGIKLSNQEHRA